MTAQTTHTNIPKLRFPEFTGEWEEKKIGNILTIGSGRDYKHLGEGNIPVYGTGGHMAYVDDYLYNGESVCIGRKGTIDKPVYLNGKFWTVDTLFYTHKFINALPLFVFGLFQKINWTIHNEASGVPSLSKTTIEKIKINIPEKEEQQKIASFLGAVDDKIAGLQKKKDLLEAYKKGMMQRLFSQSLRFTDDNGNPVPDWEENKLENLADVKTGSRDTQNRIENGTYPFFVRSDTIERINSYAFEGEAVLTSGDGVGVGKNIHYINGKFDYHQRVYAIFNFTKKLHGKFFFHYFKENFLRRVMRLSAKNSVDSVRMSMITDMLIPIPKLDEQKKIADFLSAIDDKIALVTDELSHAKTFKKGLLQQMFV